MKEDKENYLYREIYADKMPEYINDSPKVAGWYWFTDGSEHTPTILQVTNEYSGGSNKKSLWASNEEFCFKIGKSNKKDFWCYIPEPKLPKGLEET